MQAFDRRATAELLGREIEEENNPSETLVVSQEKITRTDGCALFDIRLTDLRKVETKSSILNPFEELGGTCLLINP
jgi:hypothetical protein